MDIRDRRFKPSKDYDLIISHRVDLKGMEILFRKDAIKIYLSTGMNHIVHNINLKRRFDNLKRRRECNLRQLIWDDENMPYLMYVDAIIGFGNEYTMATWGEIFKEPKYPFNNYGFSMTQFIHRNYSKAKNSFLFFGSAQQLGKGLDLLLEIFPKHSDLNLYICSSFEYERDFCKCYHKELYETPNIHSIGRVRVNGEKFYELIQKCGYVILPTCSEGQAGSVVQCMYAGLIPVVTKEAGINTKGFGVTFANDSLDEIEKTIIRLSELPEDWGRERSIRTREFAQKKFSEEAFINRWRQILADILYQVKG